MNDFFKTIAKPAQGFFKDKGSKFYSFAFPVENEDEITKLQKELRKKYYDARHHCYAFMLGNEKKNFRASDDGEPANSSGQPILGQIRSYDLTNVLIVVIRYFGGTKLGIPGLINAYKTASADALNNAEIIEKTVDDIIDFQFTYPEMSIVMRIIKEEDLKILNQDFQEICKISVTVRKSLTSIVIQKLSNYQNQQNIKYKII